MTERITLQERASTPDGQGGFTVVWSAIDADATDVAARVKPMSGAEARHADRISPRATYTAWIYYRADANGAPYYTPAHRVVWRGRYYNIIHAADVESESLYLFLVLNEGDLS